MATEWFDTEPESLADPLRNIEWAVGEMLAAIDEGRYRFEAVHVRADLNYLRGESRRAARHLATPTPAADESGAGA